MQKNSNIAVLAHNSGSVQRDLNTEKTKPMIKLAKYGAHQSPVRNGTQNGKEKPHNDKNQKKKNEQILNFMPLPATQRMAGIWEQRSKSLIKRHASIIKKKIFIAAVNYRFQKEGKHLRLKYASGATKGDEAFERDLNAHLFQLDSLQQNKAEQQFNQTGEFALHSNLRTLAILKFWEEPQLITYFANNLELLPLLQQQRDMVRQDWALTQFQMPCGWLNASPEASFSAKHPHFVWHRSKRLLSDDLLEEKWESLDNKQISIEMSEYVIDSIDMINDQVGAHVGIQKADPTKKAGENPSPEKLVLVTALKSDYILTANLDSEDRKRPTPGSGTGQQVHSNQYIKRKQMAEKALLGITEEDEQANQVPLIYNTSHQYCGRRVKVAPKGTNLSRIKPCGYDGRVLDFELLKYRTQFIQSNKNFINQVRKGRKHIDSQSQNDKGFSLKCTALASLELNKNAPVDPKKRNTKEQRKNNHLNMVSCQFCKSSYHVCCLQKAYISQADKEALSQDQFPHQWSKLCRQLGINQAFNIENYNGVFAESLLEAQISTFVRWSNWTCLNCCLTMAFELLMPPNENQSKNCLASDQAFQQEIKDSNFTVEELTKHSSKQQAKAKQ